MGIVVADKYPNLVRLNTGRCPPLPSARPAAGCPLSLPSLPSLPA